MADARNNKRKSEDNKIPSNVTKEDNLKLHLRKKQDSDEIQRIENNANMTVNENSDKSSSVETDVENAVNHERVVVRERQSNTIWSDLDEI
ncbi:hypothetical protein QE152_g29918 [Popillia japonica]|uniref:Uncharacterized protein n=1 Tax=Popillia japonica TaxID=7064 RepID=A0AAW1JG97_POPJA